MMSSARMGVEFLLNFKSKWVEINVNFSLHWRPMEDGTFLEASILNLACSVLAWRVVACRPRLESWIPSLGIKIGS